MIFIYFFWGGTKADTFDSYFLMPEIRDGGVSCYNVAFGLPQSRESVSLFLF